MPTLSCGLCSVSLLESASVLPENVHLICGKCRAACEHYLTDQCHLTEQGAGSDQRESVPLQEKGIEKIVEETVQRVCAQKIPDILVPICEASTSEAYLRSRNQKSLIVSGLAEMEGDQDLASFLNRTLLPAI